MNRLERLEKILNKTSGNPYHDEKGRFTFNPGQGRGVGKPDRGFSSPTVIYTGDDIALEKDGVLLEGTLQYKDGKFYLLTDKKESRLIEISKDDVRRSIVTKSAKQKKKELLESQGIRHKTPKERRTPEQKRLISELDKMGLFKNKELGSWCTKYADEETLDDIYITLKEAESLGLDVNSIQLEKIRSGRTWGKAYYRTDGNFKLALSGQIYDRNPIQEKEIKECRKGFHTDNSIKAVVRHETGHIISYQNAQRSYNTKDKPENIWQQEDKVDSYCGKVVSEAMGYSYFTYRETLKDLKKYSNSEISEYGRTNFKEAIAESWSNPDYSEFTKKVSDILKKDLKKPRENSIMNERVEEIQICSGYGPEFEGFEYETSTGKVKINSRIMRLHDLEKVINSQKENLDYRYDVKAYKEYLKEWLKHKDEKEYLDGGVLSFAEFCEHDIDYEFEDYKKILKLIDEYNKIVSPNGNSISKNEDGSYQLILKVEKDKTSKNNLKIADYLRNNLSAKSYFRNQRLSAILNKVNRGNPYHDSEGKFTSKGGSFGSSALITEKGKEIDKKFKSFSDIALELKEGTHKVLGKEISGKRFDLVSGDILVSTINDNAEDENRIEEIKQQIEKDKKSGVVLITIDENEKVKIRDGSHTFAAYLRLRDEGKNYYIPFILSTPSDIDRWEKKFDSIEELEKTNKDLVNVKQFKINKEDEE